MNGENEATRLAERGAKWVRIRIRVRVNVRVRGRGRGKGREGPVRIHS